MSDPIVLVKPTDRGIDVQIADGKAISTIDAPAPVAVPVPTKAFHEEGH